MEEKLLVTLSVSDLKTILSEMIEQKLKTFQNPKDPQRDEPKELPKLITRQKVSELFGVSLVSIDKWRRYGLLPPTIKQSGRTYFMRKDIEAFLQNKINNLNKRNHGK